jgi:hypothetical protein
LQRKNLYQGLPNIKSTCLSDHMGDDLSRHVPNKVPNHTLIERYLAGIFRVRD